MWLYVDICIHNMVMLYVYVDICVFVCVWREAAGIVD